MKQIIPSGSRFGKTYSQIMRFILMIKLGKRSVYHAPDYVIMDRDSYEEIVKRKEEINPEIQKIISESMWDIMWEVGSKNEIQNRNIGF